MLEITKTLGEAIRDHRRFKGLSQEELGEIAGMHRTYVGMVERGEKNITLANLVKVSQALDITASELLRQAEERL